MTYMKAFYNINEYYWVRPTKANIYYCYCYELGSGINKLHGFAQIYT